MLRRMMKTMKEQFPYASQRMPVMGQNMVAASQPLAAQAGLEMLRHGGNAVDAALATAITLTVVEPTMNGIGGDGFCILWDGKQLHGLNASGRSPMNLKLDQYRGLDSVPQFGWPAVTVPGQVSGWVELSKRFGRLPFERLFASAIDYAEKGFMVTPVTARLWNRVSPRYTDFEDFSVFTPGGRAPQAGELFRNPDQARSLQSIAESRGESFYRGELAEKFVAASTEAGGSFTLEDLDQHRADWVELISHEYHGYRLHEIPPNGQGLAALIMLGMLEYTDHDQHPHDSADALHLQIEAMKFAFADAHRYVSDPDHLDLDISQLLDPAYLESRAKQIDLNTAGAAVAGVPTKGNTVYLTAADESGMMVSYIQSNYDEFGSGIVIPGTGISLQNRGTGFTLEEGHPNQIGPGKRPFHTIIPAFLTRDGKPLMSYGVMGGGMQPQGHAQMVLRMFDQGMNPQAAVDAPRWQVMEDGQIRLEAGLDDSVRGELRQRGHDIPDFDPEHIFNMGGAQLIHKIDGGYIGGSDPRKDGLVAAF